MSVNISKIDWSAYHTAPQSPWKDQVNQKGMRLIQSLKPLELKYLKTLKKEILLDRLLEKGITDANWHEVVMDFFDEREPLQKIFHKPEVDALSDLTSSDFGGLTYIRGGLSQCRLDFYLGVPLATASREGGVFFLHRSIAKQFLATASRVTLKDIMVVDTSGKQSLTHVDHRAFDVLKSNGYSVPLVAYCQTKDKPDWQDKAVAAFLESALIAGVYDDIYQSLGRALRPNSDDKRCVIELYDLFLRPFKDITEGLWADMVVKATEWESFDEVLSNGTWDKNADLKALLDGVYARLRQLDEQLSFGTEETYQKDSAISSVVLSEVSAITVVVYDPYFKDEAERARMLLAEYRSAIAPLLGMRISEDDSFRNRTVLVVDDLPDIHMPGIAVVLAQFASTGAQMYVHEANYSFNDGPSWVLEKASLIANATTAIHFTIHRREGENLDFHFNLVEDPACAEFIKVQSLLLTGDHLYNVNRVIVSFKRGSLAKLDVAYQSVLLKK